MIGRDRNHGQTFGVEGVVENKSPTKERSLRLLIMANGQMKHHSPRATLETLASPIKLDPQAKHSHGHLRALQGTNGQHLVATGHVFSCKELYSSADPRS